MKRIIDFIIDLPSRFLHRWKSLQLIAFIIVIGLCLAGLTFLRISSQIQLPLPEDHPYARVKKRYEACFPSADFIIVTLESTDLFGAQTLAVITRLTEEFRRLEHIQSVVSLATTSDIVVGDDTIGMVPLLASGDDPVALQARIAATPLFRHFLLSDDGKLFTIYLLPDNTEPIDNDELIASIRRVAGMETGCTVKIWGNRVLDNLLKETVMRDFLFLGILAVVIVFAVMLLFARSLKFALLLFISSFVPTVMTMSLFPLFGIELQVITIMVPVIVLALSTSYILHLARYYTLNKEHSITVALTHATPVILFTGGSTILGFLTLLFSYSAILRRFGIILVLGIVFAVIVTLFFLPPLLMRIRACTQKEEKAWRLPLLSRKGLWIAVLLLAVVCMLLIPGIGRISYDYRISSLFMPRTAVYRDILYLNGHFRGFDELELVIDSGREYGLVDVGLYRSVSKLVQDIGGLEGVSRVISFTTFVDWLHEKFVQPGDNPLVNSEESIGENLEIMTANDTGFPSNMLIDMEYRCARILIRFGAEITLPSRQAVNLYRKLTTAIKKLYEKQCNGVSYALLGHTVQNEYVVLELKNNQFMSIVSFLFVFAVVLFIRFKSPRIVLLVLLPGIANILFFTGIMGWLTVPLSINILVAIAVIMGVSTDDAVYFMQVYQSNVKQGLTDPAIRTLALAGKAIIYTTLIIILGLGVLVLSEYQPVIQTSLLIIATFVFADMVILFILPGLCGYFTGKNPRKGVL